MPTRNVIARKPEVINSAIWKEGASVFGRRPDLFGPKVPVGKKPVVKPVAKLPMINDVKNISLRQEPKIEMESLQSGGWRTQMGEFEHKLIQRMVKSERKLAKYERNRSEFFSDSNTKTTQVYWNLIGRHL